MLSPYIVRFSFSMWQTLRDGTYAAEQAEV